MLGHSRRETYTSGYSRWDNYITKDGTVMNSVHHNTLNRMVTL